VIDLIKNKEILVVGMARSGLAAVELLSQYDAARITVSDSKKPADLKSELSQLKRYQNVDIVAGSNPAELVTENLSFIVKSPGVPPHIDIFKKASEVGIPVISEIELAYAFIKAPIIGVTGTNGKTTTTALITAMLEESRFEPVISAGNIGNPLSGLAGKFSPQGIIVAELSSFQLEDIKLFRPFVAVFLNFAEDHLDYHGSIEKYFKAKVRILENQSAGDYAVLNAGDRAVASLQEKSRGRVLWFDRSPVRVGVGLEDGWITLYNPGSEPRKICPRNEVALPGDHNLENALAASTAAWAAGADPEAIGRTLGSFRGIEHRLEYVRTVNGIDFINDSKGTNPGATIKALESFPGRNKVLIAGGKDKGSDFAELAKIIKSEVRKLILLGETKDKLAEAVDKTDFSEYLLVADLKEAVSTAFKEAQPGDLILLSPACASWDMFNNYEERGDLFKELVSYLPAELKGKEKITNG
jgi:UDP-N-acetylmuramoylalanine--D-glutamate ligase